MAVRRLTLSLSLGIFSDFLSQELDNGAFQGARVQFPAESFGTPDAKKERRAHLIYEQSEPRIH